MHPAVAGDHLIDVVPNRTDENGRKDSIRADTLHQILHLFVVYHLKGMVPEGLDLYDLYVHCGFFVADTEQFLYACQFNFLSWSDLLHL